MQGETKFKMKVLARLKELGTSIWLTKIQQVTKRGDPDIIMCVAGTFVAWELKVGKNKTSKLQDYALACIETAGGIARVVTPDNLESCLQEVQWILKSTQSQ